MAARQGQSAAPFFFERHAMSRRPQVSLNHTSGRSVNCMFKQQQQTDRVEAQDDDVEDADMQCSPEQQPNVAVIPKHRARHKQQLRNYRVFSFSFGEAMSSAVRPRLESLVGATLATLGQRVCGAIRRGDSTVDVEKLTLPAAMTST